jgi:hypothetical protein
MGQLLSYQHLLYISACLSLYARNAMSLMSRPSPSYSFLSDHVSLAPWLALASLVQYDKKWSEDRGYVFYDYNSPEEIPLSLMHTFDVVVIDPPFITHEVSRCCC